MKGPWGEVSTANITSDPSGISYYDEALFIQVHANRLREGKKAEFDHAVRSVQEPDDDDLKAMFAYLRTVKPVKHHVDNSEPPTYCKLCRLKHGGGDQN